MSKPTKTPKDEPVAMRATKGEMDFPMSLCAVILHFEIFRESRQWGDEPVEGILCAWMREEHGVSEPEAALHRLAALSEGGQGDDVEVFPIDLSGLH